MENSSVPRWVEKVVGSTPTSPTKLRKEKEKMKYIRTEIIVNIDIDEIREDMGNDYADIEIIKGYLDDMSIEEIYECYGSDWDRHCTIEED